MHKKGIRLNNVILPVWLLWIFPIAWLVVIPANFIIDLLVIVITLKVLKVDDTKGIAKKTILKVWLFGFISDFIGAGLMLLSQLGEIIPNESFNSWWYDNILEPTAFNPFSSFYAIIFVAICIAISAVCIYWFNYKISFKKVEIEDCLKKKLSLSIAIFTAPYLFLLPTQCFIR